MLPFYANLRQVACIFCVHVCLRVVCETVWYVRARIAAHIHHHMCGDRVSVRVSESAFLHYNTHTHDCVYMAGRFFH